MQTATTLIPGMNIYEPATNNDNNNNTTTTNSNNNNARKHGRSNSSLIEPADSPNLRKKQSRYNLSSSSSSNYQYDDPPSPTSISTTPSLPQEKPNGNNNNSSNDFLCIISSLGNIQYSTPSIETLLGYSPTNLLGQLINDYIYPEELDDFLIQLNESISTGSQLQIVLNIQTSASSYITFDVLGRPFYDGNDCKGVVLILKPNNNSNSPISSSSSLWQRRQVNRIQKEISKNPQNFDFINSSSLFPQQPHQYPDLTLNSPPSTTTSNFDSANNSSLNIQPPSSTTTTTSGLLDVPSSSNGGNSTNDSFDFEYYNAANNSQPWMRSYSYCGDFNHHDYYSHSVPSSAASEFIPKIPNNNDSFVYWDNTTNSELVSPHYYNHNPIMPPPGPPPAFLTPHPPPPPQTQQQQDVLYTNNPPASNNYHHHKAPIVPNLDSLQMRGKSYSLPGTFHNNNTNIPQPYYSASIENDNGIDFSGYSMTNYKNPTDDGLDSPKSHTAKPRRKLKQNALDDHHGPRSCDECGAVESPEWRKGPKGPKTLCNACGLRWAKKTRKEEKMPRSANSATSLKRF